LAPGFSRPVRIRGINATENVSCVGLDPTSDVSVPAEVFDENTSLQLVNNQVLGMVCTRSGSADTDGTITFDEGVVTILTDVSPNGNYSLFIPRDAKLADNVASAIQARIDELTLASAAFQGRIDGKLQAAGSIEGPVVRRGTYPGASESVQAQGTVGS